MLGKALVIIIILIAIFSIDQLASSDEEGIVNTFIKWKEELFSTPDRLILSSLRDEFLHNNMSLLPHQTDYIVELTQKHQEVQQFHKLYCIGSDKNPYLYGDDLQDFCLLIRQSGILSFEFGQ
ncbi:MAG: hypothetical protein AAGJ37_09635 [Pseudomonadota bacterium]